MPDKPETSKPEDLKIILKSGTEFTFSHIEPKKENLIKVNINYDDTESINGEGIWACISDKDKEAYENHDTDEEMTRVALLRNTSIAGIPWGAYVPYRLNGQQRPTFFVELMDLEKTDMTFNMVDTLE